MIGCTARLPCRLFSPIAQLGRISTNASSVTRAAKKRAEMIAAFDELSSHLHTTFSALSTALARSQTHGKTDTVYLALVLGPTIGAPKARVVLVLEGLEVKIWGQREDVEEVRLSSAGPHHEEEGDSDDCSSDGDAEASGSSDEDADKDADSDIADADADADAAKERSSSPPASEPPSSRSPSPLSDVLSQPSASAPASTTSRPLRLSLSSKSPTSSSTSQPYLAPKPARTHAEEQQTLRAAERLLARTLVNANAEGGGGMAVELGAALPPFPTSDSWRITCFLQPRRRRTSCSARLGGSRIRRGSRDRTSARRWTRRCAISSSIPALVVVMMRRRLEMAGHDGAVQQPVSKRKVF
jgi:hypothetical protein